MAVSMGLGVFILIITTAAISAGYYFAMGGVGSFQITADLQEDIAKDGAILFNEKGCADCHYADKGEIKIGPGLKDLFKKDKLPASARPVTEDNIRRQLMEPFRGMPAYPDLPEKELQALLAFLKSI